MVRPNGILILQPNGRYLQMFVNPGRPNSNPVIAILVPPKKLKRRGTGPKLTFEFGLYPMRTKS